RSVREGHHTGRRGGGCLSIQTQLDLLETSGLIELAAPQPDLAYLFRHALVQEAAYSSLLKQHRKALHLTIAEALESATPNVSAELAPILARHYDEGEEAPRALKYYVMAADYAARQFAAAESLGLYSRALELARFTQADSALLGRIWLARGRALEMN